MRQNASKWVLFYWEKRNVPKCVRNASNLRQKCAEHLNPEGPAIEKNQSRSKISIPARNFQSRLKFSISIENFNPRVSIYGALVVYREGLDRKFQSTIERLKFSIPKAAIDFFQSPGPLGNLGENTFWTIPKLLTSEDRGVPSRVCGGENSGSAVEASNALN